jgi:hypothetical protein
LPKKRKAEFFCLQGKSCCAGEQISERDAPR